MCGAAGCSTAPTARPAPLPLVTRAHRPGARARSGPGSARCLRRAPENSAAARQQFKREVIGARFLLRDRRRASVFVLRDETREVGAERLPFRERARHDRLETRPVDAALQRAEEMRDTESRRALVR